MVQKSTGVTMIVILGVSDFIYGVIFLIRQIIGNKTLEEDMLFYIPFALCLYFSIYWASAMAYLVFKSLQEREYNIKYGMKKLVFIVFILAVGFTALWHYRLKHFETFKVPFVVLFSPLALSLLTTFTFYWKSIRVLKSFPECELKSSRLYIRNLQLYSFAQMITFGPIITVLSIYKPFDNIGFQMKCFAIVAQTLSALSGFVNSMIYLSQLKSSKEKPLSDYLENEMSGNSLSLDII